MMRPLNVNELGQVFTPRHIVSRMLALRQNRGNVLEPSVGDGAFFSYLGKDAVGIEVDSGVIKDERVLNCDFFQYPTGNKFDTIIGNPPYVRYQDIHNHTKSLLDMSLFDKRSNLYLFFIAKCIEHLRPGGEIIFITPRDFMKASSSQYLNAQLYEEGSFTHYYDLGDAKIFNGATPNCAIWRWEKGRKDRHTGTGGDFRFYKGQIWFGDKGGERFGDYFDVKVGAVSGADRIFTSHRGETMFVCSTTVKDGKTRKMIYNRKDESLYEYKQVLLNRKIKKFDLTNWWEWGRRYYARSGRRIYVNCKTRNKTPFYISDVEAYDGSVLGIFPKTSMDIEKAASKLNSVNWEKLGFICGGRLLFTQRSLENAPVELAL